MKIKEMKEKLLDWRDFYGQDIADREGIRKAKSINKLNKILLKHEEWLINQNQDALTHLDNFRGMVGIF